MDYNNTTLDRALPATEVSARIAETVMTLSISAMDECPSELKQLEKVVSNPAYFEIATALQWCQQNLTLFKEKKRDQSHPFIESGECWRWLELVSAYLDNPEESSYSAELSTELLRNEWPKAYNNNDLQSLLLQLKRAADPAIDVSSILPVMIQEETKKNPPAANQESGPSAYASLSFSWDEETHPEFLEAYFEETTEVVSQLAALLPKISRGELDSEARYNASRLAHTIKGSSAIAGATALSKYCFRVEKILDHSVKHQLDDAITALLPDAADCLQELFLAVKDKTGEPAKFATIYSQLSEYAESIEDDGEELTLGKPELPDFITQQSPDQSSSVTAKVADVDTKISDLNTQKNLKPIDASVDFNEELTDNDATTLTDTNDTAGAELDELIMSLASISTTDDGNTNYSKYHEKLSFLTSWAELTGYSEIARASQWCQQNLSQFAEQKLDRAEFIESGESWLWLELISAALSSPEEPSLLADLTAELMREEWVTTYLTDDLQNLLIQLKDPSLSQDNESAEDADKVNSDEQEADTKTSDTSELQFSWDNDVHPELLASYLHETPEHIRQITSLLIKISKGNATTEDHQHASRIAHTIKGASGVVGISALVDFTHKLEDILDYSIQHPLPDTISSLLAEASDCLEDTFDAIQSKEPAPEEFTSLLQQLTQYSETLDQDDLVDDYLFELEPTKLPNFITKSQAERTKTVETGTSATEAPLDAAEVMTEIQTPSVNSKPKLAAEPTSKTHEQKNRDPSVNAAQEPDFSALVDTRETISTQKADVTPVADTEHFIRVPVDIIDKLLNLVGELVITSTRVADKIDQSIITSKHINTQDDRVHKMLDELDSTLIKQEKEQSKVFASLQESDFDILEMDTYNELHSISGLLTESILDAEAIKTALEKQLHSLKDDLHSLDTLNNDLSEVVLSSRMVSIDSLVPRLERIVRQTSKKTKKRAKLLVTGKKINIDSDILNGLTDPLLHLLRNAIDHGIEYPADRIAAKKEQTGNIHLEFTRLGNNIQMLLKDDGAGIDAEKIYQQAIKKGITPANQSLSEEEKLQLILHAGLSTQDKVTDISGRGVGMDVVNNAVKALNGTLSIKSDVGKGTTFTVTIPLTLVTSATLLINVAGRHIAIPSDTIEQLFYLPSNDVIERNQGFFVMYEDEELPIQSMASLLDFPSSAPDFTQSNTLLIVKSKRHTHAIYIDEIINSRQAVVKSTSDWLDTSHGLIGACHLPDGNVAPVINLPQILNLNEETNQIIKQIQINSVDSLPEKSVAKILVVDDSLSNRKALSLIIEQTDYEVLTAVDGLDALQIMNENPIDLVFTDMEMPRMNGVELTQAIRTWDDKKETPIVMITSRTTAKHRKLAEKAGVDDYLTKPVITETLLNSIAQWLEKAVA